jgi:hypothetical protein
MLAYPVDELPPIGPIDPEQSQLFTGAIQPGEEKTRPRRVGDRGGRDEYGEQETQGIDQHMAFTPFDVFPVVVAALPAQFRSLDALAIETARRRVLMTPCLLAHLGAQGVVEALPVAAIPPLAAIPVDTGPLGLLMRQPPPFDASIDDIKDRIDHRSHIQLAGTPTRLGWRDQIFDTIPFGISEVCRVWLSIHPSRVLN